MDIGIDGRASLAAERVLHVLHWALRVCTDVEVVLLRRRVAAVGTSFCSAALLCDHVNVQLMALASRLITVGAGKNKPSPEGLCVQPATIRPATTGGSSSLLAQLRTSVNFCHSCVISIRFSRNDPGWNFVVFKTENGANAGTADTANPKMRLESGPTNGHLISVS